MPTHGNLNYLMLKDPLVALAEPAPPSQEELFDETFNNYEGTIGGRFLLPVVPQGVENLAYRAFSFTGDSRIKVVPPLECAQRASDLESPEMKNAYTRACAIMGMRYGGTQVILQGPCQKDHCPRTTFIYAPGVNRPTPVPF